MIQVVPENTLRSDDLFLIWTLLHNLWYFPRTSIPSVIFNLYCASLGIRLANTNVNLDDTLDSEGLLCAWLALLKCLTIQAQPNKNGMCVLCQWHQPTPSTKLALCNDSWWLHFMTRQQCQSRCFTIDPKLSSAQLSFRTYTACRKMNATPLHTLCSKKWSFSIVTGLKI